MENKIIKKSYTLSDSDIISAYKLSGGEKARFEKNRNTTIVFGIVMLLLGYSIFNALSGEKTNLSKYLLISYIAFEVLCCICIAVTWLGGKKAEIKSTVGTAKDIEYKIFINQNGLSVIIGSYDEQVIEKGKYILSEDGNIFLLLFNENKKLVIPKSIFTEEETEKVREFLK